MFKAIDITSEFLEECKELSILHNEEVEVKALNMDWERYQIMQDAGMYRAFEYREDGLLVGYCGFVIVPSHHHEGLMAMQDVIFIKQQHRFGMVGYRFLRYCIAELEESNIKSISLTTTVKVDLSKLYQRLGFDMVEKTFRKLVKE